MRKSQGLTFLLIATVFAVIQQPKPLEAASRAQLEKLVYDAAILIETEAGEPLGSGVVFRFRNYKTRYVITAYHVVCDQMNQGRKLRLRSYGRPSQTGLVSTVSGWHHNADVASVKLPKAMSRLRGLRLSFNYLRPNDKVGIYAFPNGRFQRSIGVIRECSYERMENADCKSPKIVTVPKYRYTNYTRPGSSGGMVVNDQGHLMGIHTHGGPDPDFDGGRYEYAPTCGWGTPSPIIIGLIQKALADGWQPE